MSAARREQGGGGGRGRGRAAARPRSAARGTEKEQGARGRQARGKRAEQEEPSPRGRARARSSRETKERQELAVRREPTLAPGVDLLREVIGDLLAPWETSPRFAPPVDVRESADDYEVVCELPGIAADDVHVSVHGDRLRIEGEKRWRTVRDDEFVHAIERGQGRFVRAFRLPFVADADRVDASFEDGLLRVRVPKPGGGAPRSIEVRGRAVRQGGERESLREPTEASGGVQSARPPHRPKDEGPLPLERREEAYAPETTADLEIPHVGGRQAPVGGQGAEQTSAGGIPQPGGEEKTPTKMKEPPGSEVESNPGGQDVQGLQGGGGGGRTP